MTPKDYFAYIAIKHPDLLEGAVEYAFQFDQIGHEEYRHWVAEIKAIEAQKTEQLLKVLAA